MATKQATKATTPSTSTNGTSTTTATEGLTARQRYSLSVNAAIKDLREFGVLQPSTKTDLGRSLRGRNSAELMQAQADWMLTFTSAHSDPESMQLLVQLLSIVRSMDFGTSTTEAHSPAEILAVRVWAIRQAERELSDEYDRATYEAAVELITDEADFKPYIGEANVAANVAAAVKAAKTHTVPRGRAAASTNGHKPTK